MTRSGPWLLFLPRAAVLALVLAAPVAANECAFVAASGLDAVTVIDVGNDRITGFLPVGLRPAGVAVSGDGRRAWVANTDEHTVTVLDLTTRRAIATVGVGLFPTRIAVHPGGRRIYVSDRGSDQLSVIDAESSQVIDTIGTEGDGPAGLAITRDGLRAWVGNSFSGRVVEIDLEEARVLGGAAVGSLPFELALTPDDSHLYVANAESATVSVVRTADRAVVATIPVGGFPNAVAVHRGGRTAYVGNAPVGSVAVIDTATNMAGTPIFLGPEDGSELASLALSSDGTRGFVPEYIFANLFSFDTARNQLVGFAPLGGVGAAPEGLAVARIAGRCPASPEPLLTAAASAADTTLYLERADLLPAAGTLRIGAELLTYEGRQLRTAVLNAERGVGGTAPAAHAAGSPAQLVGQRGDANCDGRISAADFAALPRQAPSDWRPCGGDLDHDGAVTASDLLLLIDEAFVAG